MENTEINNAGEKSAVTALAELLFRAFVKSWPMHAISMGEFSEAKRPFEAMASVVQRTPAESITVPGLSHALFSAFAKADPMHGISLSPFNVVGKHFLALAKAGQPFLLMDSSGSSAVSLSAPMPEFEDAHVQIVYRMLSDMGPYLAGKPDQEHWEGRMAQKIVQALRSANDDGAANN